MEAVFILNIWVSLKNECALTFLWTITIKCGTAAGWIVHRLCRVAATFSPQSGVQSCSINVTTLRATVAVLALIPSDFPSYSPLPLTERRGWVRRIEMRFYLYKLLGKEKSRKLMEEQVPGTHEWKCFGTQRGRSNPRERRVLTHRRRNSWRWRRRTGRVRMSVILIRRRRKNNGITVTFSELRSRRWGLLGSRFRGKKLRRGLGIFHLITGLWTQIISI